LALLSGKVVVVVVGRTVRQIEGIFIDDVFHRRCRHHLYNLTIAKGDIPLSEKAGRSGEHHHTTPANPPKREIKHSCFTHRTAALGEHHHQEDNDDTASIKSQQRSDGVDMNLIHFAHSTESQLRHYVYRLLFSPYQQLLIIKYNRASGRIKAGKTSTMQASERASERKLLSVRGQKLQR